MLSLLEIAPCKDRALMAMLQGEVNREKLEAAYHEVVALFGESNVSLREVLGELVPAEGLQVGRAERMVIG